jgi:hypothetical protein
VAVFSGREKVSLGHRRVIRNTKLNPVHAKKIEYNLLGRIVVVWFDLYRSVNESLQTQRQLANTVFKGVSIQSPVRALVTGGSAFFAAAAFAPLYSM